YHIVNQPISDARPEGAGAMPSMSALGHKQTSAHVRVMSALPPIADIWNSAAKYPFVPKCKSAHISQGNDVALFLALPTAMPKLREVKGSDGAFCILRTRPCSRRWLLRRCP